MQRFSRGMETGKWARDKAGGGLEESWIRAGGELQKGLERDE